MAPDRLRGNLHSLCQLDYPVLCQQAERIQESEARGSRGEVGERAGGGDSHLLGRVGSGTRDWRSSSAIGGGRSGWRHGEGLLRCARLRMSRDSLLKVDLSVGAWSVDAEGCSTMESIVWSHCLPLGSRSDMHAWEWIMGEGLSFAQQSCPAHKIFFADCSTVKTIRRGEVICTPLQSLVRNSKFAQGVMTCDDTCSCSWGGMSAGWSDMSEYRRKQLGAGSDGFLGSFTCCHAVYFCQPAKCSTAAIADRGSVLCF